MLRLDRPFCGSREHDHESRSAVLGDANKRDGTIVTCFWPDGLRDDCCHLLHRRAVRGCHHPRQPDHGDPGTAVAPLPNDSLPAIAIAPGSDTAYVSTGDVGVGSLVPVNLSTGKAGSSVGTVLAEGVGVTPDGKTAYVSSGDAGIYPVSLTNGANPILNVGNPISTGADAIALTPDGKTAYVTGESAPGVITPVDLANRSVGRAIPVAAGNVWGIAISPDGSTAYVTAATGDGVAPTSSSRSTLPPGTSAHPSRCREVLASSPSA